MKLKALKTDGLQGDMKTFVEELNKRFAEVEFPEAVKPEDREREIRAAMKGLFKEDGTMVIDPAKLAELLGDGDKGLRTVIQKQGEEIESLKKNGGPQKDLSLRGQIRAWQNRDDVKAAVAKLKGGSMADVPALDIDVRAAASASQFRVPATMTIGAIDGAYIPTPEIAPGVVDLVRQMPTFWDYVQKGRTNRATYVWVNKVNKEGNAQFIGEGVLKPLASFQLEPEISNAKKVAERMKASTELLEDVEGMASMIENELSYEVKMALNTALLTGTLSSTSPAGVLTFASAYTTTGIETINPNIFDAIRAGVAQLRSLFFYGNVVAFINPIDAASMELTKAQDSGVYLLPPFTSESGTRISGVTIVEDSNITQGNILIMDMTKFKVLIYKDFSVAWGWENDDFSKNLVTVIGEMRIHSFHSSNHAGAFLYDSIDDIRSAIDAAGS